MRPTPTAPGLSHGHASPPFAPLRVWLEPAAAGGRVGAWLPEVPGVHASARTRALATTAVLTATGRTREWLEARGDALGLPSLGRVQVAGEVPATAGADGSVRNAILPPDLAAVGPEVVTAASRRLGWLCEDLLELAAAVDRFELARGPLPADAADGSLTPRAVLRHVAGTAVWLAGRLDAAQSGAPVADGDPRTALVEAHGWVRDRLGVLALADGGREIVDAGGEAWTLAKIVRRLVAHGLDHLWALDRRLARADGTGARVEVVLDRRPDAPTMVRLLRSVGWDGRTADPDALGRAIAGTPEFAAAWDGDRLVGTARSLTDGAMYAHIATVVVHPRFQGLGVGERLMHALMDGRDGVRFELSAAPGMNDWYGRLGFVPDDRAMVRQRARH